MSADHEVPKADYAIDGHELTLRFAIGFVALLGEVHKIILWSNNERIFSWIVKKYTMMVFGFEICSESRQGIAESGY